MDPEPIPCFRLQGEHSFSHAQRLVTDAIAQACVAGHGCLLLAMQELEGFAPPTLSERHRMVREWADAAQGRVRLAVVVKPHLIDGEKFGVVAAGNFGLRGEVFTDEGEAAEWLRSHR